MNGKEKKVNLPPVPEEPRTSSFYGSEEYTKEMEEILEEDNNNEEDDK